MAIHLLAARSAFDFLRAACTVCVHELLLFVSIFIAVTKLNESASAVINLSIKLLLFFNIFQSPQLTILILWIIIHSQYVIVVTERTRNSYNIF